MSGGLNYEKMNGNINKPKSDNEKAMLFSKDFPDCGDLYPDCPIKPSLLDSKCMNCPKTDDIKKPKLEWVVCEHCGEEGVPVDSQSKLNENEEIKCHICDKMNSVEAIAKQRN
jgi:hypothetical protein